ncbi:exported hypothetical protein [Novosphingobium sp. KN65.2]|nr:exported hypothetical protein [Novosphingobium sp. KN65.2]
MCLCRGSFIVIAFKKALPALAMVLAVIAKAGVNFTVLPKAHHLTVSGQMREWDARCQLTGISCRLR